jgi:class 3 adenylate cyclase
MARSPLPSGTVTSLFTDIEGSTKLLHELGPQAYAAKAALDDDAFSTASARGRGMTLEEIVAFVEPEQSVRSRP